MEHVSILLKNAQVFNSYLKTFIPADVWVKGDRFYYIDRKHDLPVQADTVIDAAGKYMLPGFVDVHMHIESSMMTPGPFGKALAGYGVTTIVSEPHEMANVKGVSGILEMISAGEESPIDVYFGIPSSVPSTNSGLETTGGVIDFPAMKHLMEEKDVVCVGEVMNYRQIIKENNLEISKFLDYLRVENPQYVIEGHCPALLDLDLAKFLYLGINGDHTEHSLEEFRQRAENGMFMEIQDKMLRPEILQYVKDNNLYEYCSFVTDDTMADVLYYKGQLNYVVQKAMELGFPVEQAIYCASYTGARRMHLFDRGAIAPGQLADFMLVEDPRKLQPELVYKRGREIFRKGDEAQEEKNLFPEDFYHTVQLDAPAEDVFSTPLSRFMPGVKELPETVTVRAMEVQNDSTKTKEVHVTMPVVNGCIDWKSSGCKLALVFERHGKNGNIGYGFVTGAFLKEGTVATTYFHDHHNLFVAGDNEEDMRLAVNRLRELQGGFLTAKDGEILRELPLPVCGILNDGSLEFVGTRLSAIRESLYALGYDHYNPIMSIGTLGLPVSPALKLTDMGLIDVHKSAIVPLIVE